MALDANLPIPVVEVMINGKGPFRFGVDTGAGGHARLKPAVAEALALEPVGEVLAGNPLGGPPRRLPAYSLAALDVGGLRFRNVEAGPLNLNGGKLDALDGILGLTMFADLLLSIDYANRRLELSRGALPAADGKTVLDYKNDPRGGAVTLPLTIGSTRHEVHLDTGNVRFPLFLPKEVIASLPTNGAAKKIGTGRSMGVTMELSSVPLAAPVRFGATVLPVTEAGYPSLFPVGNIGSQGLKGMRVRLDQRNRRLEITPSR